MLYVQNQNNTTELYSIIEGLSWNHCLLNCVTLLIFKEKEEQFHIDLERRTLPLHDFGS